MTSSNEGKLKAFVTTTEQAGGFVWVMALVDFEARETRNGLGGKLRHGGCGPRCRQRQARGDGQRSLTPGSSGTG